MLKAVKGWREFFDEKGLEHRGVKIPEQAILPPSFYQEEPPQTLWGNSAFKLQAQATGALGLPLDRSGQQAVLPLNQGKVFPGAGDAGINQLPG